MVTRAALALGAVLISCLPMTRADDALHMPRYGEWRSSYVGGGGWMQEIVLSPSDPQRIYSYVDIGGVYRSDDAGRSWRMMHGTMPGRKGDFDTRSVHVDPRNADILLAALSGRMHKETVYRSEDGGLTWKVVISGAPFFGNIQGRIDGPLIVHRPDAPDELLIATAGGGVYRSSDNGLTWKHFPQLNKVFCTGLLVDRSDPKHVWLWARAGDMGGKTWSFGVYEGGFFESRDFGETWTKIADKQPTKIVQDPKNPSRVYGIFNSKYVMVSDDMGRTWSMFSEGLKLDPDLEAPLPMSRGDSFYHAIDAGPDFLVIASGEGTFYRLNIGESTWRKVERRRVIEPKRGWSRFNGGGYFAWACGWVRVSPRDPNHWYLTDWYAMYQSRDAGATWELMIEGVESTYVHCMLPDPSDRNRIHMGQSDNGYFRSDDRGVSFKKSGPRENYSANFKWMDLSPLEPSKVVAVGTPGGEWRCTQVFLSDDAGESWLRSPMRGMPPMGDRSCLSIAVNPRKPREVWLALSGAVSPGEGGPWRSEDGGVNWEWAGHGLPESQPFFNSNIWLHRGSEIAIGPGDDILIVNDEKRTLWRFDAAGGKWSALAFPVRPEGKRDHLMISADPFTAGVFYGAASNKGIWRSTDSGTTWKQIRQGSIIGFAPDKLKPGQLAYSTWDDVFLSSDSGATWTNLDSGRQLPYRPVNVVLPIGDRIVIGTTGNGAFFRDLPTD